MREWEYALAEMIRYPKLQVYEATELDRDGHYYLYRYDAFQDLFSRATVPSGAGEPHFMVLSGSEKVPVAGWQVAESRKAQPRSLRLVVG
ncbi:MAG TPA: hypothetical protein DCZ69_02105 [Syntrophobacteraceae bacterium]|nr:hypothetical protein [Syntrophobacteraceae bacterium]HBD07028.1 hypothetical protein [Syntrophobacteraceae bacterium]HBZ56275.1 hypothetical protein [Syntrophobacteraceae bacterium]